MMLRSLARGARRHLVGFVALMAALAAPAGAAVILFANNQVGPNVIAGSAAASGTTDNVIKGSLGTHELSGSSINTKALADGSVTSAKIADGSVAEADLAGSAVTAGKLAHGSVNGGALAAHAVGAANVGSDVRRRIDFDETSPADGQIDDVTIGTLHFYGTCVLQSGRPALYLSPTNLDQGNPAELDLSGVQQTPGGSPRLLLSSTPVAPGNSAVALAGLVDETGVASLVWRSGDTPIRGTLTWLVDGTHCEVHGLLMAPQHVTA
jgi:hypothetical protein